MSTQVTCPRCGATLSANLRFCTRCGAPLTPAATSEEQPANWHLVVIDGPDAGRRYPLEQQTHLGRGPETGIRLNDPQASRQHALIQLAQGQPVITDSGSRNGTFVNGTRIARATSLSDGDLIRIGNTTLKVSRPQPAVKDVRPPAAPRPITPSPPPAPSSFQSPTSEVIAVVPLVEYRKGLFKRQAFNLVLTLQHLVFARVTNEMLKAATAQARREAKEQGKGFFRQWAAQLGASKAIAQRYYQMPVEAILREHPDNFAIPVQEIRRVKTKHGSSDPEYSQPDQLIIEAREKIKLDLKGCSAKEAKNTLRQVLGDRVK